MKKKTYFYSKEEIKDAFIEVAGPLHADSEKLSPFDKFSNFCLVIGLLFPIFWLIPVLRYFIKKQK